MPVEMNEDGTVNCTPPWSLREFLEETGFEFRQGEFETIVVRFSNRRQKRNEREEE